MVFYASPCQEGHIMLKNATQGQSTKYYRVQTDLQAFLEVFSQDFLLQQENYCSTNKTIYVREPHLLDFTKCSKLQQQHQFLLGPFASWLFAFWRYIFKRFRWINFYLASVESIQSDTNSSQIPKTSSILCNCEILSDSSNSLCIFRLNLMWRKSNTSKRLLAV